MQNKILEQKMCDLNVFLSHLIFKIGIGHKFRNLDRPFPQHYQSLTNNSNNVYLDNTRKMRRCTLHRKQNCMSVRKNVPNVLHTTNMPGTKEYRDRL